MPGSALNGMLTPRSAIVHLKNPSNKSENRPTTMIYNRPPEAVARNYREGVGRVFSTEITKLAVWTSEPLTELDYSLGWLSLTRFGFTLCIHYYTSAQLDRTCLRNYDRVMHEVLKSLHWFSSWERVESNVVSSASELRKLQLWRRGRRGKMRSELIVERLACLCHNLSSGW